MTEHLTKDGTPDKRFKENRDDETSSNDESSSNQTSNQSSEVVDDESSGGDGIYKPSEHDGLTKSGEHDERMNSEHGFGGDHERAVEAGKKGGSASYENGGLAQ